MISFNAWQGQVFGVLKTKKITMQALSEKTGYCNSVVNALLNGRIVKDNYKDMVLQINGVLGISEIPEKPPLPSEQWCREVAGMMWKRDIGWLSKRIGFNRDRISLVLNGYSLDLPVIDAINKELKIKTPVLPEAASIIAKEEAE